MSHVPTLAEAQSRDSADPLGGLRSRFALPEGIIYLDGNSLGPLLNATRARIADVIENQWGRDLIRSWNDHDWIGATRRIGDKIAALIGAQAGEVVVADSTSVNLYKLIMAAAALKPEACEILTEAGNFPTDVYIAQGAAATLGLKVRQVATEALAEAMTADTAVIVLTHVNYRSGYRHDIAAFNRRAAQCGAHIVWDLSHSVGAVPLDLGRDGVTFAVGCGYKHLNGGPGAPAFLHFARAFHDRVASPITGWLGHDAPFAFEGDYRPASGIAQFLSGTPPMLSLLAIEEGVDLMLTVDRPAMFAKSVALFDLFAALVAAWCPALALASPQDRARRSGHIAFTHDNANALVQALIAHNVVGDFRTPDLARFAITPLYTRFEDIWRAVETMKAVLDGDLWRDPRYMITRAVT